MMSTCDVFEKMMSQLCQFFGIFFFHHHERILNTTNERQTPSIVLK